MAKELAITAFQKPIRCFSSDERLAAALSYMKKHEFTQIVVSTKYGTREVRLLTTIGIVAWLTDQVGKDACGPDSTIEDALDYEPPETHRIMGADHTVHDVQTAFKESTTTPGLFAVIITADGLPTGRPVGIATPWDFKLTHSEDFRSVTLRRRPFTLTKTSALAVKFLYEAYQNGTPELGEELIMKEIGKPETSRLRDSFRGSDAWNTLVIPGRRRGNRRLDL